MKFHEKKIYQMDKNGKIVLEQSSDEGGDKCENEVEMTSDEDSDITRSCKHVLSRDTVSQSPSMTSTPIKSQLVIMPSTEMPLSLDELVNIDVGLETDYCNVWGSLNVNQVPMEIVDNLYDDNDMQHVTIVDSHSSPPKKFLPLT